MNSIKHVRAFLAGLLPLALLAVSIGWAPQAGAERIKDVASFAGVRDNQLVGYGIVVGLAGTGDQTTQVPFTRQSIQNMLERQGLSPDGGNVQLSNVAAVMVTATLPPFAKPGQTIDVTVSSMGNADSLRGGELLMTPLKGADDNIYAVAQGSLVVGGLDASGRDGSRVTVNIPTAGRIPNGATVERSVPSKMGGAGAVFLNLREPDFTTARRMEKAINDALGGGVAQAVDGGTVKVRAPDAPDQRVGFMSVLENVTVEPGDGPARVVVNSRSGTVVIGQNVTIEAAAVSHGNLTVTVDESLNVSQPAPFSEGETVVTPESDVAVQEESSRAFLFDPGVKLNDIVQAVNAVGASPSDLVAILQALKRAGALKAELIVI
ncbi:MULTISPECIES: flagellar basal body P-ring protein FlgI [unclassified Guyparkeria]|uniref:flagellar basal body P-ring protein FlgI n=1 Tax=unclassified Guyparkeria TaxID=2626246 RepID=UPI0007338EC3|nr:MULTISPECIES: flagellar basal body P-ring protein FlgI [unclassified Guyparkeria]KTG16069.1 flagellar biosynthesis protein FlgI [Guyparkeria sp. XI15]OAE84920.1 flagellar biosynthesis protein FlgI [Guyparkeria sp. WRN-7]